MDSSLDTTTLAQSTQAAALHFLRTELMTGNVLLDVAYSTQDRAVRVRRVQAARDAHDVVARHVGEGVMHFSHEEWQTLRVGLAALRCRLEDAEADPR